MTIEEAIERLGATNIGVGTDVSIGDAFRWNETINMAVSALRAQQDAEKNKSL